MSDERGPSWYDVSAAAEELAEEYRCAVELRLARPTKRVDGRGYTGWSAHVLVTPRLAAEGKPKGFLRPWGATGASRTAPQAFYLALLDAQAWYEERKAAAQRQASF